MEMTTIEEEWLLDIVYNSETAPPKDLLAKICV
jgi:hypothetical protein